MAGTTRSTFQPSRNLMLLSVSTMFIAAAGWIGGWAFLSKQIWFEEPEDRTTIYPGESLLRKALIPTVAELTAVDGSGSAELAFPEPDGAMLIDDYEVQIDEGQWQMLDDSRTVTGLTNGEPYTFRVRSVSGQITGEPSPRSNEVVPYGKPGRPRNISGQIVGGELVWTWNEPADSGRELEGYRIQTDGGPQKFQSSPTFSTPSAGPLELQTLEVTAVTTGDDPERTAGPTGEGNFRTPGTARVTFRHLVETEGPGGVKTGLQTKEQTLVVSVLVGQPAPDYRWAEGTTFGWCLWQRREFVGQDWQQDVTLSDSIEVTVDGWLYYDSDVDDDPAEFCNERARTEVDVETIERTFPITSGTYRLPDQLLAGAGATGSSTEREIEISVSE